MVWSNIPTLLGPPPRRTQWNPWREMGRLQEELTRLFGEAPTAAPTSSSFPPLRLVSDEQGARLTALVPGLSAGDVEVVIERDLVKLAGTRQGPELQEGQLLARQERHTGSFARSIRLPFEIDASAAEARVENGVLEVVLPRTPEQRPRRIEVQRS